MLCHCYRLTAPHEHSLQACTSQVPVPPRHTPTTANDEPIVARDANGQPLVLHLRPLEPAGESISAISVRIMQEQVAEEQAWSDKLRPQIERELRHRIADEIEHDHVRGMKALTNILQVARANHLGRDDDDSASVVDMLEWIRLQIEHWLCGIRDGSVGRKP